MPTKYTWAGWENRGRPQPDAMMDYNEDDDYNNIGAGSDYNDETSGYEYPATQHRGDDGNGSPTGLPTKHTWAGYEYRGRAQPDGSVDYNVGDDYNKISDDSDYNDAASGYDYSGKRHGDKNFKHHSQRTSVDQQKHHEDERGSHSAGRMDPKRRGHTKSQGRHTSKMGTWRQDSDRINSASYVPDDDIHIDTETPEETRNHYDSHDMKTGLRKKNVGLKGHRRYGIHIRPTPSIRTGSDVTTKIPFAQQEAHRLTSPRLDGTASPQDRILTATSVSKPSVNLYTDIQIACAVVGVLSVFILVGIYVFVSFCQNRKRKQNKQRRNKRSSLIVNMEGGVPSTKLHEAEGMLVSTEVPFDLCDYIAIASRDENTRIITEIPEIVTLEELQKRRSSFYSLTPDDLGMFTSDDEAYHTRYGSDEEDKVTVISEVDAVEDLTWDDDIEP